MSRIFIGPLAGYIALSRTKTSFSLERKMVGPLCGSPLCRVQVLLILRKDMCTPEGEDFLFSRAVVRRVDGHLCRRLPLWLLGGFVEK